MTAVAVADIETATGDPVPDGSCRSWDGPPIFPAAETPLRRLWEVEVHAVDSGLPALIRRLCRFFGG